MLGTAQSSSLLTSMWHSLCVTFAEEIFWEVLQRIVTLGYILPVHLCRGAWRRHVKRTLDKVWGCQNAMMVKIFPPLRNIVKFSERNPVPICGSVKAAHMRGSFEQAMPGNLSVESPRGSGEGPPPLLSGGIRTRTAMITELNGFLLRTKRV